MDPPKPESTQNLRRSSPSTLGRTLIFLVELGFILLLLIIWFSSDSFRLSQNLWVLFFYSFPAEFLIAVVPHEPMLLYFGKFYSPLTVALVAVSSTILTEALNYSVFKYVSDLKMFEKIHRSNFMTKLIELFNKAPFTAIMIAGFTPVPFYPFRFMVVMAHYPIWKYILATFLSRTPRFFILAQLGYLIKIPDVWLVVLFIVLLASIYLPLLIRLKKSKKDT